MAVSRLQLVQNIRDPENRQLVQIGDRGDVSVSKLNQEQFNQLASLGLEPQRTATSTFQGKETPFNFESLRQTVTSPGQFGFTDEGKRLAGLFQNADFSSLATSGRDVVSSPIQPTAFESAFKAAKASGKSSADILSEAAQNPEAFGIQTQEPAGQVQAATVPTKPAPINTFAQTDTFKQAKTGTLFRDKSGTFYRKTKEGGFERIPDVATLQDLASKGEVIPGSDVPINLAAPQFDQTFQTPEPPNQMSTDELTATDIALPDVNVDTRADVIQQQVLEFHKQQTQALQEQLKRQQAEFDRRVAQIEKLGEDLANRPQRLEELREEVGLGENMKKQQELNTLIAQKIAGLDAGLNRIADQPIPLNLLRGQQQALQSQGLAEIKALQAQQAALQDNMTLARQFIKDSLDVEFGTIEQQIAIMESFLDINREQMATTEKNKIRAIESSIATMQGFVAEQKEERAQFRNLQLQAIQAGAPADLLDPELSLEENIRRAAPFFAPQPVLSGEEVPVTSPQRDISDPLSEISVLSDLERLRTHMGLSAAVGKSSVFNFIPGTQAASFVDALNSVKSKLTLPNLEALKGNMSDKDITFISSAATTLNTSNTEADFRRALDDLISRYRTAVNNIERQ